MRRRREAEAEAEKEEEEEEGEEEEEAGSERVAQGESMETPSRSRENTSAAAK